jgi:hypothetical protein
MAGTRRSRRHTEAAAPRTRRRGAFTLAALLAVFLQAFVAPTHIHAPRAPLNAAIGQLHDAAGTVSLQSTAVDEHQTVACAVCRTLAGGNVMLAASATSLVADRIGGEAATYALPRAPPTAAHPWQSRAPPQVLQA